MNWWKDLKGKIKFNEPLKEHTTFQIGGRCDYFIEPKDADDLKSLLKSLKRDNISFLVIGSGSNILAGDRPIKRAIIRLGSPCFKKISFDDNSVQAGSGCSLPRLVFQAAKQGLSGYEFLAGIPGTVGGALIMNAGRDRKNGGIGDLVESVSAMDRNGRIRILRKTELKFAYRRSNLEGYLILGARLKLKKGDSREIKTLLKEYLDYRKGSQDYSRASAGCIFKNPAKRPAGRLIDLCGLKGKRMGGACVSNRHANFIINAGQAKAGDVLRLMAHIRKKVKDKFNITLEPEIKIWK